MYEDMILPNDFEESQPQETQETVTDAPEVAVDDSTGQQDVATDAEIVEQAEQVSPFLQIKYNKEEMALDEATARELAQKGMNYDKTLERLQALETDPRLSFVEQLAKEQGMDVQDYIQQVRLYQEQQQLNQLVQQNIPEEYAREMLENRKFREQFNQQQEAQAQQQKENADFNEFFDYYRQANGRDFVPNQDEIPVEVWEMQQQGVPLKFAYMQHQNQQLQNQLNTLKQNESNAKKAPVTGVTKHGSVSVASEDDFLKGFSSYK